jgi:hypothetical protein
MRRQGYLHVGDYCHRGEGQPNIEEVRVAARSGGGRQHDDVAKGGTGGGGAEEDVRGGAGVREGARAGGIRRCEWG